MRPSVLSGWSDYLPRVQRPPAAYTPNTARAGKRQETAGRSEGGSTSPARGAVERV